MEHPIDSFITRAEGISQESSTALAEKFLLYSLVRATSPTVIIETGTHRGKTTLWLARAAADNGKGHVHTCDPYDWNCADTFNQFPELSPLITYYPLPGIELPVTGIDFAFIDGFHTPEEVEAETVAILPKLNKGATVVFHDTYPSDVPGCDEDVSKSLQKLGLATVQLNTSCGIRIYHHED